MVAGENHAAFIETGGADPDWAIWYAGFLCDRLAENFSTEVSRAVLVDCFLKADVEHRARMPERDWAEVCAELFLEHLGPAARGDARLALYYFDACRSCQMVLRVLESLEVEVEMRDVFADPQHRADPIGARGRATVPVLRITEVGGTDRWIPESRDIARCLQKTKG